ncbi:MAG: DUF4386 domain-containing protein [Acidobacteriota bacterium]
MTQRTVEASPQVYARIGGLLYLIIIVAGILGEMFIRGALVVSGDAAATAGRIAASPQLWRIGVAGDVLMHVCDIPLMLVFYVLLRPVNRNLALLAVLFNLVQTAVASANKLNLLVAQFFLGEAGYLKALAPQQQQALAYLSIKAHGYGFSVALVFFGCECLVVGYLIFRSGYLPRVLGILMAAAGLSYLINSFALILAPAFAAGLFPAILLPAFIGEVSLCLWLLIKGVNIPKWEARLLLSGAGAAPG